VSDASGTARLLPAFARSRRAILLPAFSPFAGGLDMSRAIPTELREMLGRGPVQVAVTTGRRVMSLKLLGGD
jgi:metallophosphoesterase superfamily enzyme